MVSPYQTRSIEKRLTGPPNIPALFVSKTRNRLKHFMIHPFHNLNFSKRVFIDKATSIKAYLYKAYHTGKGDDFESVAVVVANPSLPMDCSKMGVFGQQTADVGTSDSVRAPATGPSRVPVRSIDSKTDAALWHFGGHFYTFQIDARPDTTAADEEYGKGVFPVQHDYVIIKPPVWRPAAAPGWRIVSTPAEVVICEYKGGPDQRVMAGSEAVQLNKGYKFFKRMYGENNVNIKLFYIPYLATNPNVWGPKMPRDFPQVDFLSLSGLSKLLSIPVGVIENTGSGRAEWLRRFETKLNQLTAAVLRTVDGIANENNKDRYLQSLVRLEGPNFTIGTNSISFRNLIAPSLAGASNLNWKNRHQQLTRALATREQLKVWQADPALPQANRDGYALLYKQYTYAIKKLNKINNADPGILDADTRRRINAAWSGLGAVNQNFKNTAAAIASTNKQFTWRGGVRVRELARDSQFAVWLQTRQLLLRAKANVQWGGVRRLQRGRDFFTPRVGLAGADKTISEILSYVNSSNNNKLRLSKSRLDSWLTEIRAVKNSLPLRNNRVEVCNQIIDRLLSRNVINNGAGGRRRMTSNERAWRVAEAATPGVRFNLTVGNFPLLSTTKGKGKGKAQAKTPGVAEAGVKKPPVKGKKTPFKAGAMQTLAAAEAGTAANLRRQEAALLAAEAMALTASRQPMNTR
jgi:hypothetical protein